MSAARCGSTARAATNEEGLYWRYEMAVRELESRLAGRHRRQRRDQRGAPRRLHLRSSPPGGQDISFPFELAKRGLARACTRRERGGAERMAPTLGDEFARKRRMMRRRLGHDAAARDAVAARLRPALRLRDRSRIGCCATLSPLLHLIALGTNIALLGRGLGLRGHARRPARAAGRGRARRRFVPLRPFRIAHYYVRYRRERRRALGLPAPRRAADLGEGGGHAMSGRGLPRVADLAARRASASCVGVAAPRWSPRSRSSSTRAAR